MTKKILLLWVGVWFFFNTKVTMEARNPNGETMGQMDKSLVKVNINNLQPTPGNLEESKENSEKTKENTIVINQDDLRHLIGPGEIQKLKSFSNIVTTTEQLIKPMNLLNFMIAIQPLVEINISNVITNDGHGIKILHGKQEDLLKTVKYINSQTRAIAKYVETVFLCMGNTKENRLMMKEAIKQENKIKKITVNYQKKIKDLEVHQKKDILKIFNKNEYLKKIKNSSMETKTFITDFFKQNKVILHDALLFVEVGKENLPRLYKEITSFEITEDFLKTNIFFEIIFYLANFNVLFFLLNTDEKKTHREEIINFKKSMAAIYWDLIEKKLEKNQPKSIQFFFNRMQIIEIKLDISQPISSEEKILLNNFANINLTKYLEKIKENETIALQQNLNDHEKKKVQDIANKYRKVSAYQNDAKKILNAISKKKKPSTMDTQSIYSSTSQWLEARDNCSMDWPIVDWQKQMNNDFKKQKFAESKIRFNNLMSLENCNTQSTMGDQNEFSENISIENPETHSNPINTFNDIMPLEFVNNPQLQDQEEHKTQNNNGKNLRGEGRLNIPETTGQLRKKNAYRSTSRGSHIKIFDNGATTYTHLQGHEKQLERNLRTRSNKILRARLNIMEKKASNGPVYLDLTNKNQTYK
jgi:hypothetical protein